MSLMIGNVNSGNAYSNKKNVAFGVKVPTEGVVHLVTGTAREGNIQQLTGVISAMTGRPASVKDVYSPMAGKCYDALIQKFPVLNQVIKNVNNKLRGSSVSAETANALMAQQVKLLGGAELDVPTITI